MPSRTSTREIAKTTSRRVPGSSHCCEGCRRDYWALRRNPDNISEAIEEIADVLHGR